MIAYQLIEERFDLQIEEVFWSEELIPNKPEFRYYVTESTGIVDDSGKSIGELKQGTRVFSDAQLSPALMTGVIYGWIWHQSVLPQGDILTLINDENVRGRADGTIFGRLSAGTLVRQHYLNQTQAWYLFSTVVTLPGSCLAPMPADYEEPSWASYRPTFLCVTTKQGGYRIKSWLTLGDMFFFVPLGAAVLVFLTAGEVKSRRRVGEKASYVLEFWKSALQVFSGFAIAALIYFFGFKQ